MSKWVGWITLLMVLVSAWLWGQETGQTSGPWAMERSGTTAGLRGIHAVGGGVAWASGTNGTVLRTEDGGYEWQTCAAPPDSAKLDFRGIWAWDDQTAIVMASGTGDASRLYKTTDGCSHWTLVITNPDKDGFWDAMVFRRKTLLGDPVRGKFAFKFTPTPERGRRSDDLVSIGGSRFSLWSGSNRRICRQQYVVVDGRMSQ